MHTHSKQQKQKDPHKYQLHIKQIKLLKKIEERAALVIRDDQNTIIKSIPFATQDKQKQPVNMFIDLAICCPKFCLVLNSGGSKYDQEVGRIQVNKDHNLCYIYTDKYPYQIGCSVKYKLEYNKKKNHFEGGTVIFTQLLKQQTQSFKKKKRKDILNISQQKQLYYQPDTKIIQLSEQQKQDDSVEYVPYKQSYDYNNKKIVVKVREASQMLDKSLQKSQDQKKIFSKYLDESTSFINQLLGQLNNKQLSSSKDKLPKIDISAINEEKQYKEDKEQKKQTQQKMLTQQKWYKSKFNKINTNNKGKSKKSRLFKIIKTGKQTQSKVQLTMPNQQMQESTIKKQFSDIVISSTQKPNQINLFVQDKQNSKLKKIATMTKQNGQPSSAWPIQLAINYQYSPIHISCVASKQEFVGFIGKEEEKVGECQLFDKAGNTQGYLYFKCKQVSQIVVQTQDLIALKQQSSIKSQKKYNYSISQNKKQSEYSQLMTNDIIKRLSARKTQNIGQDKEDMHRESQQILLISRSKTMPQMVQGQTNSSKQQDQNHLDYKKPSDNIQLNQLNQFLTPRQEYKKSESCNPQILQKRKSNIINFKIINIDAKLNTPNFIGKFLKIQMNQQGPYYFTQLSKQMFFLNWKGKGYLFFNCSKVSNLIISMFQQNQQVPTNVGHCKINLSLLQPQYKRINKYQDYIRNQKEESIGTIYIQYQFFQKNHSDLQSIGPQLEKFHRRHKSNHTEMHRKISKQRRIINAQQVPLTNKTANYTLKGSTISQANIKGLKISRTQRNSSVNEQKRNYSVGNQERYPNTNKVNKSSLRLKKYNGGNIIIPRADRFETKDNKTMKNPGPGSYQYPSQFQRYASPS